MKREIIILFAVIFLASVGSAELQGYVIEIENGNPAEVNNIIYRWSTPDQTSYYQDAYGDNPDLGLMICDTTGTPADKYVGLEYLMDSQNNRENQLVSYGDTNLALADISTSYNGMNCKRTSISSFTVSPSVISGTPTTKIAAFPAEAYMIVSDSQDGSNPEFLDTGSQLAGSYTGSLSYSYSGNQLNLDLSNIYVNSDQGVKSFDPDASGRGITSDRPLIIGACEDVYGLNCSSGSEKITSASSTVSKSYGLDIPKSNVNDQTVYTRYAVANGKNFASVNIGADLDVRSTSVSRNTIYYSQNQTVSFDLRNTGNVPIETDFQVTAEIVRNGNTTDQRSFTVSQKIDAGTSKRISYDWKALTHSGSYDVNIRADTENEINEINENNNAGTTGFQLKPVTFPTVVVDETVVPQDETEFMDAGVPYNLTLRMKNSDNDTLSNSLVRITEKDSTNSLVPTQKLDSNTVTESRTRITFRTDQNGTASITIIPRGNVLLSEKYSDLSVQDEIDYHLRMTGEQSDGTDFKFIRSGNLQNYYRLEVSDPGTIKGNGTSDLPNLQSYTKIAMDGVYSIFAEFWGAVT